MGPIASVGMVVAINTSDSTFGWYGKRQGLVSRLWLADKNEPMRDCYLEPIKGVKVAYHHWEQVPVEDQTLRTGLSQWELAIQSCDAIYNQSKAWFRHSTPTQVSCWKIASCWGAHILIAEKLKKFEGEFSEQSLTEDSCKSGTISDLTSLERN